jgi:hypothetical protein
MAFCTENMGRFKAENGILFTWPSHQIVVEPSR